MTCSNCLRLRNGAAVPGFSNPRPAPRPQVAASSPMVEFWQSVFIGSLWLYTMEYLYGADSELTVGWIAVKYLAVAAFYCILSQVQIQCRKIEIGDIMILRKMLCLFSTVQLCTIPFVPDWSNKWNKFVIAAACSELALGVCNRVVIVRYPRNPIPQQQQQPRSPLPPLRIVL